MSIKDKQLSILFVIQESSSSLIDAIKGRMRSVLKAPIEILKISSMNEEEIINSIAEFYAIKEINAVIILNVTGPLLIKNLKKIFKIPFLSFDNVIFSFIGKAPLARAILLVLTDYEEKILLTYKKFYELIPNQIYVLKNGDLKELLQLYEQGYHTIIPCSIELIINPESIEALKELKTIVNIEDPLNYLYEEILLLGLTKDKPSSYEIKKILPCIADAEKIRFVAQLNANVENLLPILYIHLKNSKYLEALDALTFTTNREEMVTIYGNGKVYAGKVKDEARANDLMLELLDLLTKAYDYFSNYGMPSSETLEARSKLSPMMVYNYLPKLNCGKCNEKSCFTFAIKLISGERKLEECMPLMKEIKYHDKKKFLEKLFKPLF